MPMLDLHRDILEEFAAVQALAGFADDELRVMSARAEYVRELGQETVRRARVRWDAQIRSNRTANAAAQPPPLAVEIVSCSKCGKPAELRAGCLRPSNHRCRSLI